MHARTLMARKPKTSPYDNAAGRGTGDYLAQSPSADIERVNTGRAVPPGAATGTRVDDRPPDSTMLGAFLSMLFCFPPLGLFAVIYALQVRPRWKRGDEAGAKHSAQMAEKLTF